MNQLFSDDVSLDEATHTYTLISNPNATFVSTTTLIHKFFAPFDKEKIAKNLVKNVVKYASYTVDSLIAEWNQAGLDGTKVHNEIENYILYHTPPTTIKAKHALKWLNQFTTDKYKWYPEVIIYSEELGISGTIDLLIHDPTTDIYIPIDWKTNKAIRKRAFGNKKGIHPFTKHLQDSNYWHYAMQLSIYRYILEQYYAKTVKTQALIHLEDRGVTEHELPYLKDVVELIAASN